MKISEAFSDFPAEAALIGRMLAGYTDLELDLMHCVCAVNGDFDTVIKAMYRSRGETQRINVADAFGRQSYRSLGLGTEFEMALGAMRQCMRIRNQFAHCIWWNDNTGQLALANLEEIAGLNEMVNDLGGVNVHHVNVVLLEEQFGYFEYTSNLLIWVLHEGNKKAGRSAIPNLDKSGARKHPDLFLEQSLTKP